MKGLEKVNQKDEKFRCDCELIQSRALLILGLINNLLEELGTSALSQNTKLFNLLSRPQVGFTDLIKNDR